MLQYLFNGVQQPEDWAHPRCLEKLGLHPLPAEPQPNLWEKLRMAFVDHMLHLMEGNRDIEDHETLIKVLHVQIIGDHPSASQLGVVALHKLVAQSVVTLVALEGSMPSVLRAVLGVMILTPQAVKPSVLLTPT